VARRTTIAILVALLLSILVIAIILSVSAKWPWIEVPYPINKTEKLRFIRYLSCSFAMCSGRAKDGDICKSPEVLSVGLIEFEKGKEKTCRELCDELKAVHGVKDKYCGKAYAINFTFDESIEYVANYSIDPLNTRTYRGKCGPFKSGRQTDLSCYGNIEELTDCSCLNCIMDASPPGRIWFNDFKPNCINITKNLLGTDVICENTTVEEADICKFKKGLKIVIWAQWAFTALPYCGPFGWCIPAPFGWCGGLKGFGCPCYALVVDKPD